MTGFRFGRKVISLFSDFMRPGQKINTGLCFLHNNQHICENRANLEHVAFPVLKVT